MAEKKIIKSTELENVSGGMSRGEIEAAGFKVTPEDMVGAVDANDELLGLQDIDKIGSIDDIHKFATSLGGRAIKKGEF